MRVKFTEAKTKDISKCYQECPYFGLEGGPGPVMVCKHPKAEDGGYIISHPQCDTGFPKKCPIVKEFVNCRHNARCRYTNGFHCEDCNTFFHKDSPTYRRGELLSTIWMVLHNINAQRSREGLDEDKEVAAMREKIGIGVDHENYEELITEAETVMWKHRVNSGSAQVVLR